MLQSQLVLVIAWALAVLASIWVLGPLLLFLSPLRRHEIDVQDDPREAEPRGNDRDYERSVAELKAAGFAPVGKTIERFRFFTPLHWIWRSDGARWFASPDREVFVELERLAAGHPQTLCANTIFDGGGLLATSTAPSGMGGEVGDRYRRVEVEDRGVAALLHEHERHVADFSRDAGLHARAGTLAEMAAETHVLAQPFVTRNRFVGLYLFATIYLLPLHQLIQMSDRPPRLPLLIPGLFCGAAALFALIRLLVLPEFKRFRWVAIAAPAVASLLVYFLMA
jgi:hypothetical protein